MAQADVTVQGHAVGAHVATAPVVSGQFANRATELVIMIRATMKYVLGSAAVAALMAGTCLATVGPHGFGFDGSAAYAAAGGNGHGNGHGAGGNSGHSGNSGLGGGGSAPGNSGNAVGHAPTGNSDPTDDTAPANELGRLNVAHASDTALANAAPNSAVGKMATYKSDILQGDTLGAADSLSSDANKGIVQSVVHTVNVLLGIDDAPVGSTTGTGTTSDGTGTGTTSATTVHDTEADVVAAINGTTTDPTGTGDTSGGTTSP